MTLSAIHARLNAETRAEFIAQWKALNCFADWKADELLAALTTSEIMEQVYDLRADNGEVF